MKRSCVVILCLMIMLVCLAGCAQGSRPDVALVEFPGLKWCDTPDRVVAKLDLDEEQILENALYVPGEEEAETEYDVWNLVVKDWIFMDSEVVGAHFMFIRYPGGSFGLMRVQLYFSDDTDMRTVRANMIETYGEGTTEPAPQYVFADGKLTSTETNVVRTEEGLPHFWYATVTGSDVLSAQAVEQYVQHIANSDAAVGRAVAVEYLDAVPVVSVCCANQKIVVDPHLKSDSLSISVTDKTVIFDAGQMVHILQQFEK